MKPTTKVLQSGTAALVLAALAVSVAPATAANEATGPTADNVNLVMDIDPGPGDSFPQGFTVFGDRVLFSASDSANNMELWVTDGTPAGTRLVEDINPGLPSGGGPSGFTIFGDRVLFEADDGVHGVELWVTDGTTAGTSLVKDVNPGGPGGLRYGGDIDNEAFVRLLYANVLDRAPDPAGLTYWLAQLDTTLTRSAALVAFSESPENIDRTNTTP